MEEEKQSTSQSEMDEGLVEVIKTINRYHQEVTITGVRGSCPYGHREGEKFIVTGMNSDGLCGSLYQAIHPLVSTLEYGGGIPWEKDAGVFKASCPEIGKVQVVIRRFENEDPMQRLKTKTDFFKDMTGKGFSGIDKYRVFIEVLGIEKNCMWGHRVGGRCEVDAFNIGGICGALYEVVYPFINLLLAGGSMPWEGDKNIIHGACPDPYDLLSYRLIREER